MIVEPNALPWDGGCRCDRVRIRVTQPPLMSAACHCRGCQRMTSSAFSLTLMLPAAGLLVVEGEPVVGGIRGPDAGHMFCDFCKTWVFTRIEAYGLVNLRATMLDSAGWFVPYMETFTSVQLPWARTPAVHSFSEFPPPEDYPDLMAQYANWARERKWPVASTEPAD